MHIYKTLQGYNEYISSCGIMPLTLQDGYILQWGVGRDLPCMAPFVTVIMSIALVMTAIERSPVVSVRQVCRLSLVGYFITVFV